MLGLLAAGTGIVKLGSYMARRQRKRVREFIQIKLQARTVIPADSVQVRS